MVVGRDAKSQSGENPWLWRANRLNHNGRSCASLAAASVAIGVLELGFETSAEIGVKLFVVLSALTEGESFDIVMSAGGDHSFESWRKLHGRWNL